MCFLQVFPYASFSPAHLAWGKEYMKHHISGSVRQTISAHVAFYSGSRKYHLEEAEEASSLLSRRFG